MIRVIRVIRVISARFCPRVILRVFIVFRVFRDNARANKYSRRVILVCLNTCALSLQMIRQGKGDRVIKVTRVIRATVSISVAGLLG